MDYLLLSVSIGLLLGAIVGYDIGKTVERRDNYITYPHMSDLHIKADNLVDACVAMIEKLHELKML